MQNWIIFSFSLLIISYLNIYIDLSFFFRDIAIYRSIFIPRHCRTTFGVWEWSRARVSVELIFLLNYQNSQQGQIRYWVHDLKKNSGILFSHIFNGSKKFVTAGLICTQTQSRYWREKLLDNLFNILES